MTRQLVTNVFYGLLGLGLFVLLWFVVAEDAKYPRKPPR